jgi:hypothetical protein
MAFVEGIGDEVIGLLVVVLVVGITTLLWTTTHVQDRVPVVVQILPRTNQSQTRTASTQHSLDPGEEISSENTQNNTNSVSEELTSDSAQSEQNRVVDEGSQQEPIKIRCQFLDETSLQVDTRLTESLSGLKTRHLIPHLRLNPSNGDNVRLIFNGRVLQGETITLAEAGVGNNCVIHCLVHRNTPDNEAEGIPRRNANRNENVVDISDLDLSNVCYPLLGSVLMAIWWCQVVYAHYFTMTSTLSLVSLTVLYLASAANTYLHN